MLSLVPTTTCYLVCINLLLSLDEIIGQIIQLFLTGLRQNSVKKLQNWSRSIYYDIRLFILSQVTRSYDQSQFFQ